MIRHADKQRSALRGYLLLAAWVCVLLRPVPGLAQDLPNREVEELRRQLQLERAARKALTYRADMRRAAQLAEAENWSALRAVLEEYRPPAVETDLRSWEWHFLDCLALKKQLADRQQLALRGPGEGIRQLTWSSNGERLAAVGEDGSVVLWDTRTGKEIRRLGGGARYVAWDRDGRRLTISAQNHTVTLWETDSGRVRRFFGPYKGLFYDRRPAFSPDGRMLALAVDETGAAIVDAATGRELHRIRAPAGLVSAVAWGAGGKLLATGTNDGTITVWDAATGKQTAALEARGDVLDLGFGPDGRQLGAVVWRQQATRSVRIWDVARREGIFTADYPGGPFRPIQHHAAISFSADGKRVAAESADGVAAWETATERLIFRGPTGTSTPQANACDPEVRRWAFLEMFGTHATCRLLEMETAADLFRVEAEIPMNRYQSVLAWSPDGRRLAAGFSQGNVFVYGTPKDRSELRIVITGPASFFEWSPDGKRFAFSAQGEVRLGSVTATERPGRLSAPLRLPVVVSLSPDGRSLAGADHDGTLPIWDVAAGQITRRLPGHPPLTSDHRGEGGGAASALLWSPDGRRLASIRGTDGGVQVWDARTGKVLSTFQFGSNTVDSSQHDALPLTWSRDGNLLAARIGWPQKTIRVLDVTTGRQTREWDGGPALGSSNAMAWDPTGRRLATCLGNPPRIQVWAMTTGAESLAPEDRVLGLHAMSWSPDGRRLAYLIDKWQIYDVTTRRSMPVEGFGEHLLWKPDGSQFVLVGTGPFGRGVVEFHDAATGKVIPGERGFARPDPAGLRLPPGVNELANVHLQSVTWSEGGLVAAADATPYPGAGLLVVWDVRTGEPLLTLGQVYDALADRARVARMVAWAPDGRSLAALAADSNADARIDVWDSASGRKTRSIAAGRVNFRGAAALAWSPDGRSLAFASEVVQVWKLAIPWLPLTLRQPVKNGPEADQTFLAWSADSRSLAVLDCRDTAGHEQILTAWDLTTGKERFRWARPYESSYLHAPVAWSPDGTRLAWGGPKAGVWNVASGGEEFPLAGHGAAVGEVAWSADGRRVLSRSEILGGFSRGHELKVWDVAMQQEMLMLRGPMAGWLVAPGFRALASPPGRGSDPGDVVVWDLASRNE